MDNVKRLTKKDYNEIFKLSEFAFQNTLTPERKKQKEEEFDLHDIWGYVADGNIAAKLHTIPLYIYINGKEFAMGGVNSVATWPEYRRQGIAKKLLLHALQEMKKAGQTISFLHPFHVGFYRRFGWELTFTNRNYTIPIEKLRRNWKANGYISRNEKSISFLHSIYTTYAKKYNGMLKRDENWWRLRVLKDDGSQIAIAYDVQHEAEGYIIYKVKHDIFEISELVYTTTNGMNLLYQFIANHDSMAEEVKMTVPENDLIPYIIEDPMFEQELEPYFMARIVDVPNFLMQYLFTSFEGNVHIQLVDEFLPGNSGTYNIRNEKGQASITKTNTNHTDEIECSVQQFAAICLGFKRPTDLYSYGLIKGKKTSMKQLDKMIPKAQTFFADFY